MKLEVWERYLCWCNFWKDLQDDPHKTLDLKIGRKKVESVETVEKFTEFIVYDPEENIKLIEEAVLPALEQKICSP